jgi:hypothetical protein
VPWGTLPTSPSSPMSAPPTPHQSPTFCRAHRRHEPTPVCLSPSETPNWVPPSSRACFTTASSPTLAVDRPDFTSETPAPRGGRDSPASASGRKAPWAGVGRLWSSGLGPFVLFHIFHSEVIQNSFQFSLNF